MQTAYQIELLEPTGANVGFESTLWATSDRLRGNMDPSEYKHVVLGLIFLKYISDGSDERANRDPRAREDGAGLHFAVPKDAYWAEESATAAQTASEEQLTVQWPQSSGAIHL